MRLRLGLALVVAALAACPSAAAQAPVAPHVLVGMGENDPALFTDARFESTGIRNVRLIVPYDLVDAGGWQLASADDWLRRARRRGLEPLVAFAHSGRRGRQFRLPSVAEYAAGVRKFRERYPWVREYATWNEANHKGVQPTGRFPLRTAALYRQLRGQCLLAGCRALAADVLLTGSPGTWDWIRTFRRGAGPGPHVWGVHNYPEVNRLRGRLTRTFVRRVRRDEVWITETGGVVKFKRRWPHDERRAGRAVRHAFRLAAGSPRITRLYLYNWFGSTTNTRWDSGFMSPAGEPRHAYFSLLEALELDRFRPLPPPVVADEPPEGPLPAPGGDD